jgi:hypothetical protein
MFGMKKWYQAQVQCQSFPFKREIEFLHSRCQKRFLSSYFRILHSSAGPVDKVVAVDVIYMYVMIWDH